MPTPRKKSKGRRAKRKPKPTRKGIWSGLALFLLTASLLALFRPWEARERVAGRLIKTEAELQIALARAGFSPGSVDGIKGLQTRQALRAFQSERGLEQSGIFDAATQDILRIEDPVFAYIELTENALNSINPKPLSWKNRGTLSRLGFNSVVEMVGERTQSDPDYIKRLNPNFPWRSAQPGDRIIAPRILPYRLSEKASSVEVYLSQRRLALRSAQGQLLFHSPVSIARNVEKRPIGELKTTVLVQDPNYTFNPNILTTAAEREGITSKFVIQPGPNNPVGTVWIGLDRPSYGIHGTPEPEKVGRTESSGCFRLANWNAETVLHAIEVGTTVTVYP